jgi:hypothetical protein
LPLHASSACGRRELGKGKLNVGNRSLGEGTECLDGHAAPADVENDAMSLKGGSLEGGTLRVQVNEKQLACKQRVADFSTLFGAGV